jgi:hypothetical protein
MKGRKLGKLEMKEGKWRMRRIKGKRTRKRYKAQEKKGKRQTKEGGGNLTREKKENAFLKKIEGNIQKENACERKKFTTQKVK